MWIGVTPRFSRFDATITPTAEQLGDGITSIVGIVRSLNRNYHGESDVADTWFLAGSWGKRTNRYPFNDADVFYVLPDHVYWRIEQTVGNKQSNLLQEVKRVLAVTYPQTDMRGDGQVVQVRFNHLLVEIVPAFRPNDGLYLICDTNNGGSWKTANPWAEIAAVQAADDASSGNARRVIRMTKVWKEQCGVPMKSYILETIVSDFMTIYAHRNYNFYWYDWFMRDFFSYLRSRANTYLRVPDGNVVYLGDDWLSRATSAHERALKACAFEYNDQVIAAGEEWQKIFGPKIPIHV